MYRILMTGMTSNLAGIETFVLNIFRNIDKNKFQIDFIKRTQEKVVFEDELLAEGVKIIYVPRKYSNLKEYREVMDNLFKNNKYDAIWDNSMRIPNIDFLVYAKKYGVKERIIHSHISNWKEKSPKKIFHYINRYRINNIATKFFACSNLAADFMFTGKGRANTILINNAIDFNKYIYSNEKREELKKKYNLKDEYIIGHVGRINPIKNQKFLVEILNELKNNEKKYRLVLVGDVAKEAKTYGEELNELIEKLGLQDKVIFAGRQLDMSAWLSLMDVFVMPSLYEGLPFAAVEAQANGLPLILGAGISRETDITGNTKFIKLEDGVITWSEMIVNSIESGRTPSNEVYEIFSKKGYILDKNINLIEEMLLKLKNNKFKGI